MIFLLPNSINIIIKFKIHALNILKNHKFDFFHYLKIVITFIKFLKK